MRMTNIFTKSAAQQPLLFFFFWQPEFDPDSDFLSSIFSVLVNFKKL